MANPLPPTVKLSQILRDIKKSGKELDHSFSSLNWLGQYARQFKGLQGGQVMRSDPPHLTNKITVGKLYLYFYDPKLKKKLPYFDRFPCVFPIGYYDDGMLGINLHYLHPTLRARLMDALYDLEVGKVPAEKRLVLSYQLLNAASKYKWFKPCVKRYLNGHIRSRFLEVPYSQWPIALMLPMQQFQGKSGSQIWAISAKKIRGLD